VPEEPLDVFDRELAAAHMRGQWQVDRLLQRATLGPTPAGVPFRWAWREIRAKLERACEVMPDSFTARRNISFVNPGLQAGRGVTTHTMTAGMQLVKPAEVAEAHRHTIAALRFAILGGERVYTVVDGQPCPMGRTISCSRPPGAGTATTTRRTRLPCGWTCSTRRSYCR
jgi:1-hydroxy-2-naphthoate dioxygenase